MIYSTLFLAGVLVAVGARPEVKCSVPLSPVNGQLFMAASGTSVKYTCNPGFELRGSQIALCKGDQWYPEAPTCEPVSSDHQKIEEKQSVSSTPRPLFKWDDDETSNMTNDTMQSDSVVYYNRAGVTWPYYYRAPLHSVDEHGQPTDEALQHYYYWASQYPRSALVDYRVGHQLSESQWAWINSLHPELRDQYIKDLHLNGVSYYSYPHGYLNPYYVRQPVAAVSEDPVSVFDYSCHRTERDGTVVSIKAPRLSNAHIHRYDRRQNRNYPHNDYLAAEYRCKAGYRLLDHRFNELYCSRNAWVGTQPVCVPVH